MPTGIGLLLDGVAGVRGGGIPAWEVPRDSGDGLTWYTSFQFATWAYNVYGVIVVVNGRWYDPHDGDYSVSPDDQLFTLDPSMALLPGEKIHCLYWPKSPLAANPNLEARLFAGGSDGIDYGHDTTYQIAGNLSVGFWTKLSASSVVHGTFLQYGVNSTAEVDNHQFYMTSIGASDAWNIRFFHDFSTNIGQVVDFPAALKNDRWYYIGATRNPAAKTVTLYVIDELGVVTVHGPTGYSDNATGGSSASCKMTVGNAPGGVGSIGVPLKGTMQEHYVSTALWGEADHVNASLGSPLASGLVLSVRVLGNNPEKDESPTGSLGAVTGTTMVPGH